ncbi:MAG: UvrD-helicase domain-containing protein [Bacteroides thetaiotaomicron]|nr:UvrD-helicase domain-containing protein [Bacteroides thetaiotaomicron]
MSATEAYCASMEWKRAIHQKNQTMMIECYAWEKLEGNLLNSLKKKLEAVFVVLTPLSSRELWKQVVAEDDSLFDGMIELFETLINLIKSNGYDIETVRKLNCAGGNVRANNILLSLLQPIFDAYCQYLSTYKEIDFNDMINLATEYVKQEKYINPYKYVIVDEYQDISKARFTLLDCLRKSRDYELFCVGDDWQSIYRFAGSDVGFILDFSKYWGASEISKIETTYRFSQKLIEISSEFIMQNPAQIKKSIRGEKEDFGFPLGEISGYTDKYAIEFMAQKLNDIPRGSSVFFIGRYSFDAKLLDDCGLFTCQYNNISGLVDVKSKGRSDLKMSFLTAHKSKGLQADCVFIINNKNSKVGFPSKIQTAPILDLLLENYDKYPYAEERRLFYVALTRAKKKAFIVTVNGKESEFALELKEKYGEELKKEQFECPFCGGRLVKRSGPYGEFFGCSNYRTTGCKYKRKIR